MHCSPPLAGGLGGVIQTTTVVLSAIGYRLSAIGYRLSAIGYRLSAIGYRLFSHQLADQLQTDLLPKTLCGSLKGMQRHRLALWVKEPIKRGAACPHPLRHRRF